MYAERHTVSKTPWFHLRAIVVFSLYSIVLEWTDRVWIFPVVSLNKMYIHISSMLIMGFNIWSWLAGHFSLLPHRITGHWAIKLNTFGNLPAHHKCNNNNCLLMPMETVYLKHFILHCLWSWRYNSAYLRHTLQIFHCGLSCWPA